MIFETQAVQMNLASVKVVKVSVILFVGVLLCLYFGNNTVCSEVLHLIFIGHLMLVSYFVCLLVFLLIQLFTVNI